MKIWSSTTASFPARWSIGKGIYIISFFSFCVLCRPSNENDHLGTFKPRPFPSTYFYDFSGRGVELYEKVHHGLSLNSFSAFSSRKYFQVNLVSFMLIKLSKWPSSQYRFNIFRPNWNTNVKLVSHPPKDGWALLCKLLWIFKHKRIPMKKSPHWSILHAFRLSKIESTIEHLPYQAR